MTVYHVQWAEFKRMQVQVTPRTIGIFTNKKVAERKVDELNEHAAILTANLALPSTIVDGYAYLTPMTVNEDTE